MEQIFFLDRLGIPGDCHTPLKIPCGSKIIINLRYKCLLLLFSNFT